MIDFKTVYDEATKKKFFVVSVKLVDEKPDFNGTTYYTIDLSPCDEDNIPCLYDVPVMVDHSGTETEFFAPTLESAIHSNTGSYDFNSAPSHLISAKLNGDTLNISEHTPKYTDSPNYKAGFKAGVITRHKKGVK